MPWPSTGIMMRIIKMELSYIAVGQGVGAGIINNGELLKGCIGVAGEVGHTSICYNGPRCACRNYGCLENYCSSIAFTKEVNRVLRPEIEYNFRQVSQLLRDGDQVVTESDIFLDACDKLSGWNREYHQQF